MLTWNQLGLLAKPVVLPRRRRVLRAAVRASSTGPWRPGSCARPIGVLAQRATSIDEAIALALAPVPDAQHKWIDRDRSPRSTPSSSGPRRRARRSPWWSCATARSSSSATACARRTCSSPRPSRSPSSTPLISWSIAKSMTHAAVGLLVGDGRIDPGDPAPVPEWAGTEKETISLLDLLEMRSGLEFVEDYVDGESSHALDMLFGSGAADQAAYAAARPLVHPPGVVWNYSSGTTNIICRVIGDIVAGGPGGSPAEREAAMRAFLDQRLFGPAGMPDADPRFDDAGRGRDRRTSTPRPASSPGSASCTCVTGVSATIGCCRRGGSTTAGRRSPPTRRRGSAMGGTGGSGPTSRAHSPPTATRASTSSCCRRSTP